MRYLRNILRFRANAEPAHEAGPASSATAATDGASGGEPDTDIFRGVTTENEDNYRGAPYSIAIPNFGLRAASSIGDLGSWYSIGEAWAQICSEFLPRGARVLDIGCGCAKMARFLVLDRDLAYLGVDVFYPSIYWCRREFARHADRFRFEHLNVFNRLYNPDGDIAADEVRLPVDDASIDLAICGSLFTHLVEPAFRHYLGELRRVLKPSGTALVSLHTDPPDGRFGGTEERIDIGESCFETFTAAAALRINVRIGNVYGQQVFALAPSEAARPS